MSLKRNLAKRAAQQLPADVPAKSSAGIMSGLRPRPQFEHIVDYLASGQERVHYPDRAAKQIRNHPYLTQLDFFETVDEQRKVWEEQRREEEINKLAGENGTSDGLEKAKGMSHGNKGSTGKEEDDDGMPPDSGDSSGSGGPGTGKGGIKEKVTSIVAYVGRTLADYLTPGRPLKRQTHT